MVLKMAAEFVTKVCVLLPPDTGSLEVFEVLSSFVVDVFFVKVSTVVDMGRYAVAGSVDKPFVTLEYTGLVLNNNVVIFVMGDSIETSAELFFVVIMVIGIEEDLAADVLLIKISSLRGEDDVMEELRVTIVVVLGSTGEKCVEDATFSAGVCEVLLAVADDVVPVMLIDTDDVSSTNFSVDEILSGAVDVKLLDVVIITFCVVSKFEFELSFPAVVNLVNISVASVFDRVVAMLFWVIGTFFVDLCEVLTDKLDVDVIAEASLLFEVGCTVVVWNVFKNVFVDVREDGFV